MYTPLHKLIALQSYSFISLRRRDGLQTPETSIYMWLLRLTVNERLTVSDADAVPLAK